MLSTLVSLVNRVNKTAVSGGNEITSEAFLRTIKM